ncbi:MAG: hypothetical protein HPY60_11290 [Candidatus Methanofastidiosum sp.]|nr:hypothetical protein [Methanofastidiosum sp.]
MAEIRMVIITDWLYIGDSLITCKDVAGYIFAIPTKNINYISIPTSKSEDGFRVQVITSDTEIIIETRAIENNSAFCFNNLLLGFLNEKRLI